MSKIIIQSSNLENIENYLTFPLGEVEIIWFTENEPNQSDRNLCFLNNIIVKKYNTISIEKIDNCYTMITADDIIYFVNIFINKSL